MTEPSAIPNGGERRVQVRHALNSDVAVVLVHSGLKLHGRILDLSGSGCRVRCDDPLLVGIYTRVEAEFRLEGFPLRLGGVIQASHAPRVVGIRFLDLSARKREQLEQLIVEMMEVEQMEETGLLLEVPDPVEGPPEGQR